MCWKTWQQHQYRSKLSTSCLTQKSGMECGKRQNCGFFSSKGFSSFAGAYPAKEFMAFKVYFTGVDICVSLWSRGNWHSQWGRLWNKTSISQSESKTQRILGSYFPTYTPSYWFLVRAIQEFTTEQAQFNLLCFPYAGCLQRGKFRLN